MAVGDVYKMQAIFSNADTGKNLSFGIHGRQPALVAPDVSSLAADVLNWWENDLGGGLAMSRFCDADTNLVKVSLQRINPLEPVVLEDSTGMPSPGILAGDQYVGSASILISLRTAKAGRSYRGRAYLPMPGEAKVGANGALDAADATDIVQNFQELLDLFSTHFFVPVVWSPTLSEANDVTYIYCDRLLRTQRRRQDRASVYVSP